MAKTTPHKRQPDTTRRPPAAPARRKPSRSRGFGWLAWVALGAAVAAGAFFVAREQATGGEPVDPPARGLPATPDYHALYVDPANPERLLLGTHVGIYESTNGGVSWRFAGLGGNDAMHFGRERDGTLWAAGHEVLERSDDGGATWETVRPDGLPSRDIHGFAVSRDVDGLVYAAVYDEGLYRSDDGGASFRLISETVGPNVNALALTKDGVLFAADGERGVFANANGDGVQWVRALAMPTLGLASNRADPPAARVLAGGRSLQLFTHPRDWTEVLSLEGRWAGPVAFAASDPSLAYAVTFDPDERGSGVLYRSRDGGATWRRVG
jgi:photosystem II stability/assembly factor-like uncharacterized protein